MKQVNKWLSVFLILGFSVITYPTQAQNTPAAGTEQTSTDDDSDDEDTGKWGLAGLLGLLGLLGLKKRDDDDRPRVSTRANKVD
jgi:MYXO-CTERM domain-containing protein